MPIKIKTDLEFGDIFYLKTDPEQLEYILVGVIFLPGSQLQFRLSHKDDEVEAWDFECTKEPDPNKIQTDDDGAE